MTDTATSRYKVRQQSQGSNTNTWGDDKLNEALRLLDRGSKGYEAIAMTGDTTLTWTNYVATNSGQVAILKLTGSLSSAAALIVPSAEWSWDIIWNTTGQTITVRTSAGTGVAIPNGRKAAVFCDAADCFFAVPNYMDSITLAGANDVVSKTNLDATVAAAAIPGATGTVKVDSGATAGYLGAVLTDSNAAVITDNGDTLDIGVPYLALIRSSVQTTLFTFADNTFYPVDTSSAIAATLGASTIGAVVGFAKYGSRDLTLTPSNNKINNSSAVLVISDDQVLFLYNTGNANRGWV